MASSGIGSIGETDTLSKGESGNADLLIQPVINTVDGFVGDAVSNDLSQSDRVLAGVSMKLLDGKTNRLLWTGTAKGVARGSSASNEQASITAAFQECTNKLIDEYVNLTYGLGMKTKRLYSAKSPVLASVLSVVPGVGKLYAGVPDAAYDVLGIPAIALGGAFLTTRTATWQKVTGWILVGSAGIAYLEGFFEAYNHARRYNLEMGLAVEDGPAEPGWPGLRAGVSLRF